LYFGFFRDFGCSFRSRLGSRNIVEVLAHFLRDSQIDRTRMGLFFRDAHLC